MAVLIVLFASWLIFRGLGVLGISTLATWRDSVRHALAVMFVFTATAHFNKMKHDLAKMMPSSCLRKLVYGRMKTSSGPEGSSNFTPRCWFCLRVAGTSRSTI